MSDGFEQMVDEALQFFGELEANNKKPFYEANKARYASAIRKPAELFADLVAEDLNRLTGMSHKPKVFRIHRDVRFSKDKTPYNTHLHLMWSPPGADPVVPIWFWGLAKSYFIIGMGIAGLKGDWLTRYRQMIDDVGDEIAQALDHIGSDADASLSDWGAVPLKRVPKPYDQDHCHADLLRRKSLVVNAPLPSDWRETGLLRATNARMAQLMPLYSALIRD
ncbi:MAG: DUF2461 domain-containing protein [Pseudomonadota bacterium]